MKTYELIEVDPNPCGSGRPEKRTVIAISHHEVVLDQYVKMEFDLPVGRPETFSWSKFYEIVPSEIKIIS